jgi:hypothetical protein
MSDDQQQGPSFLQFGLCAVVVLAIVLLVLRACNGSGSTYTTSYSSTPAPSARVVSREPLDNYIRSTQTEHGPFILGYTLDGPFATARLNPAVWDRLSREHQLRLCDALGRAGLLAACGLTSLRLTIDSTAIGRIRWTTMDGERFEFDAAYLNAR